jgi:hypothetical protein
VLRRCHGAGQPRIVPFLLSFTASAISGLAAQTISAPTVSPTSIPVSTQTVVTISAQVADPSLIPASVNVQRLDSTAKTFSVLSSLYDDGTHGDKTKGDGIFTVALPFNEPSAFPVVMRVSAAFQGKLTRVFSSQFSLPVVAAQPPMVTIAAPPNLSFFNSSPITVAGTVTEPGVKVSVNGVSAPLSGTRFSVSIPLLEGPNTITAVAQDSHGGTGTASVQVTLDSTPPKVTIDSPFDGFVTSQTTLTVTGKVNDIVTGTVNTAQAKVVVNGVAAQVSNRSYQAVGVPVSIGNNTITATATDRAGNVGTSMITVTRTQATQAHLAIVSGNNQTGPVSTALGQPLVVKALDGSGGAIASQTIVFTVTQNDGLLNGSRIPKSVLTDAQGQAKVNWTVGSRAGSANGVEASAAGIAGTVLFNATGTGGSPAKIVVDAGGQQTGAVGQPLPNPLAVVVTDTAHNRLANVPVTFQVKAGGGNINKQQSVTIDTDSDGRALAILTLGPNEGIANNLVEATFSGNSGFPAAFSASAKTPGAASATVIKGVVLDNSNNPVPGATIRAYQQNVPAQTTSGLPPAVTAQSDAHGQFLLHPAPVGFVKILVDGSTVQRPGKWPNLEYELVTVSGQTNTLGMPVYLLPLDTQHTLCVSDTAGGTLTLPQVPGFSLTVQPGAATFPGGSKEGCVSVTPVHPDKIPMVPGFGQQPRFIVTIQPAGTQFNPPAQISIPNTDALKPGQITEMYGFDHDLGMFVSIGTGTASADGTVIKSDPGVGVVKAGWFCGGPPSDAGGAGDCPQCQKCNGTQCVTDTAQEDKSCDTGDPNGCGVCKNGKCVPITMHFQSRSGGGLGSPLRMGALTGTDDRLQHLAVVVDPPSEASKVNISTSGGIDVVSGSTKVSGGVISFDIAGLTKSSSKGDSSIIAKHNCGLSVTQTVTVVVPAKVATPHDTTGGGLVVQNIAADASTSPAILGVPPGQVDLITLYARFLTITVHDQFDDALGDLYAGAPVSEYANIRINQSLSATGTYLDPVGSFTEAGIVAKGSPAATAWPTQPNLPMTAYNAVQNIPVQVDGFPLSPAIAGRQVSANPGTKTVTITWP